MRIRIKQARPTSLNDAVRHAVELEAFVRAEKRKMENEGVLNSANATTPCTDTSGSEIQKLSETVERLEEQMKLFMSNSKSHERPPQPAKGNYRQFNNRRDNRRSCFECGSKSHFRRSCPRLNKSAGNNLGNNATQKDDGAANMSNRMGSGLFLQASFEGRILDCLVDTGATLSLISLDVWRCSSCSNISKLVDYNSTIISASGTPLDVKGRTISR